MGKIIKFPNKLDPAALRCKELSDAVDKCVLWAVQHKVSIIEVAAILATRVAEVIRHTDVNTKEKLKNACLKIITDRSK